MEGAMNISSEFYKIRNNILITITIVFVILKALEVEPVSGWSWGAVVLGPVLTYVGLVISLALIAFFVMVVSHIGSSLSAQWGRRRVEKMMADTEKS